MKKEVTPGNAINITKNIFLSLLIISTLGFLIFVLFKRNDLPYYTIVLIDSIWLLLIAAMICLLVWIKKKNIRNILSILSTILFIGSLIFNALVINGNIKATNTDILLSDFTNKSITEALEYASANNIEVEQNYEYSDNTPEYYIITQNIPASTKLEDIKKIIFTVSLGPNYDKDIILTNMIGMNIDEAITIIKENLLNNVNIDYVLDDITAKDVIMEQTVKGQMQRNTPLTLTVSLGKQEALTDVIMIDLKNKDLFDATLWLKRNGIKYELNYEFSETIPRNKVISQSSNPNTTVKPFETTVKLIISKGKEIVVPNLIQMKIAEVVEWIINNDLKITFEDKYDNEIPMGNIISASHNTGDKIEVGTNIKVVTSKGPLKMGTFTNLSEFRNWAAKYAIEYKEEYEFNNSIDKGKIIRFSEAEGALISSDATIVIYISNGAPVTIPNFFGKTKTQIVSTCNSIGLNCSFQYGNYSSSAKDVATAQNKKASSTVVRGTYVVITLSKGAAQTYRVEFSESLLSFGNADATISSLRSYFTKNYPDVTFTFVKKASNVYENAGFIHESSPIKEGSSVIQGHSYQVWITN